MKLSRPALPVSSSSQAGLSAEMGKWLALSMVQ